MADRRIMGTLGRAPGPTPPLVTADLGIRNLTGLWAHFVILSPGRDFGLNVSTFQRFNVSTLQRFNV